MAGFDGVKRAVAALGMGNQIEHQGFTDQGRRLTEALSRSALMDKRVKEASMAGRKDTAGADLAMLLDRNKPEEISILSGHAPGWAAAQRGIGDRQENEVQQMAIDAVMSGNTDPAYLNTLNAITGRGSFQTGKHIDPLGDSRLEQGRITAMTNKANTTTSKTTSPGAYKKPTDSQLFDIFGDGTGPAGSLSDYMIWQGQQSVADPNFRTSESALGRYLAERQEMNRPNPLPAPAGIEGWDELTPEEQTEFLKLSGGNPVGN